jgi:hypothetical protein
VWHIGGGEEVIHSCTPPFCGSLGMKHLIAARMRGGGVVAGAHQPSGGAGCRGGRTDELA